MGSLVKGFLRKVCGNSAENTRKFEKKKKKQEKVFIASGKGVEIQVKVWEILRNLFCNHPFPNDPTSELLT